MQKTAYEGLISDWSSDVCSSDLVRRLDLVEDGERHFMLHLQRLEPVARCDVAELHEQLAAGIGRQTDRGARDRGADQDSRVAVVPAERSLLVAVGLALAGAFRFRRRRQIGRASCRERVWQYV